MARLPKWWVATGHGPEYFNTKREAIEYAREHELCAFRQTAGEPKVGPAGFAHIPLTNECVFDGREGE